MSLSLIFITIYIAVYVNSIISANSNKKFLKRNHSIKDSRSMNEFKALVRVQMYQTLLQIALLGSGFLLGLYGLRKGEIGILLVLFVNGIVFFISKEIKSVDEACRNLKVEDKAFDEEYRKICETWVKKALPDF